MSAVGFVSILQDIQVFLAPVPYPCFDFEKVVVMMITHLTSVSARLTNYLLYLRDVPSGDQIEIFCQHLTYCPIHTYERGLGICGLRSQVRSCMFSRHFYRIMN